MPCLLVLSAGCAEYDLPAQQISRLSIDVISAIAQLLGKDDTCGFDSPQAKASQRIDGATGEGGSVIRNVDDCELDVARAPELATEIFGCGVDGELSGRVFVSAERTLGGLLTGAEDPDQAVIPAGPEMLSIEITNADLEDFTLTNYDTDKSITIKQGSISGLVAPRTARDNDGFCGAPTRHAAFKDVNLARATINYSDEDHDFNAIVQGSVLTGVRGKYGENENVLAGEIAINNARVHIPVSLNEIGFDPDYDPTRFEDTFICAENTALAMPLSYECTGPAGSGALLAENIGRMTVRGFSQIVGQLVSDSKCGFETPSVKESALVDGEIGGAGTMTFTVQNCTLDFQPNSVLSKDCNGAQTTGSGRVTVTATKIIRGRLTGDSYDVPVVPLSDDAVTIEVTEMSFDHFELIDGENSIHWNDGILRGKLTPRIAFDEMKGACAFPTAIARFENLAYENSNLVLKSDSAGEFELAIDSSSLQATSGAWGDVENVLTGTITAGGEAIALPVDPNDAGLIPDYDRAAFDKSWQCGTVRIPVSYECNVNNQLAEAASRIAVLTLGGLANVVNGDSACGFESDAVKQAAQTMATSSGGAAVMQVGMTTPCRFEWPDPVEIGVDCNGKKTVVRGTVTVKATRNLQGWPTGDVNEPIVPTSRDPAILDLELLLQDFSISSDPNDNHLTVRSGRLRGVLRPRVALDEETGVCSLSTPVVSFQNVTWDNANLTVKLDGRRYDFSVATSALFAQSGMKDGVENNLNGSIDVDGENWSVPIDPNRPALDPEYDRAAFDASYQSCNPNLRIPASDADCDLRPMLGKAAARALVLASGTMAGMLQKDGNCGFGDSDTTENPTDVRGDPGDYGSMDFAIGGCGVQHGSNQQFDSNGNVYDYAVRIGQDCMQRSTYVKGRITANAREHVEGLRDSVWIFWDTIYPLNPSALTMYLDQVNIQELTIFTRDPDEMPLASVTIHSGTLSGIVTPKTGSNNGDDGHYTLATPIAGFDRLALSNAEMTVVDSKGRGFNLTISSSDISAFNGAYNNDANRISGTINLNGVPMTLTTMQLDEAYNQSDFDQRYACTNNLDATLPPNTTAGYNP